MWRRISAAHEASVAKAMEGRFMDCTEPSPVFRKVRNRKRNRIRTFGDLRQSTVIRQHKRGACVSALNRCYRTEPPRPPPARQVRLFGSVSATRPRAPPCALMPPLQKCKRFPPSAQVGEQSLRLPVPISYGNQNRPPQTRQPTQNRRNGPKE